MRASNIILTVFGVVYSVVGSIATQRLSTHRMVCKKRTTCVLQVVLHANTKHEPKTTKNKIIKDINNNNKKIATAQNVCATVTPTRLSNSGLFDKIGRFSFCNNWTNVCISLVKISPSWQLFADVSLPFDNVEFVDDDDVGDVVAFGM